MAKRSYFKKPNIFPNEAFVQDAIEAYFNNKEFIIQPSTRNEDLICALSDERWVIEAKGDTGSNTRLDFHTALGQLIHRMHDENARYAIAVPSTERIKKEIKEVSQWVRLRLGIWWILVNEHGDVKLVAPDDVLDK